MKDNKTIWTLRLKEAREYSGSVKEFCTEQGITYAMLKYWRDKLEGKSAAKRAESVLHPAPFVRVAAIDEAQPVEVRNSGPFSGAHFVAEVLWHMSNRMELRS